VPLPKNVRVGHILRPPGQFLVANQFVAPNEKDRNGIDRPGDPASPCFREGDGRNGCKKIDPIGLYAKLENLIGQAQILGSDS
jgi:hypothetical protein